MHLLDDKIVSLSCKRPRQTIHAVCVPSWSMTPEVMRQHVEVAPDVTK